MTTPTDADIESVLRNMTESRDEKPHLWRNALRNAPRSGQPRCRFAIASAFARQPWASAAVVVIGVGSIIGIGSLAATTAQSTYGGRNRATKKPAVSASPTTMSPSAWGADRLNNATPSTFITPSMTKANMEKYSAAYQLDAASDPAADEGLLYDESSKVGDVVRSGSIYAYASESHTSSDFHDAKSDDTNTGERQVIRRATVEIKAADVRAVFLKVQVLIRANRGEYIQDSGIRGEGDNASAELTIRVAADRLSEFLNEMRALGDVQSEVLNGEDVTTQFVDLEARLRNERQVEAEVLQLLESRKDASLEEILKLRKSLAEIRTRIERMTGQREQMNRLVSLATVLLIIRSGVAPEPAPTSHWAAFTLALSNSWHAGLDYLGDVVAFLVRILVGGLIFWIALAGVILYIRHAINRRRKTDAS